MSGFESLEDAAEELLRGALVQVEGDLVSHELAVVVGTVDQLVEDVGHGQRVVEEDEALAHRHVVGRLQTAVELHQAAQHYVTELPVLQKLQTHLQTVVEHAPNVALRESSPSERENISIQRTGHTGETFPTKLIE